jgi:OmpA-OmpF porin, OOP family
MKETARAVLLTAFITSFITASFTLAGCTITPNAEQSVASKARITDRAIFADQKAMQELQDRLAILNKNKSVPLDSYHHAKAQCWLDVAAHEYHRNDRSGFIEYAIDKTKVALTSMENGALATDSNDKEPRFCSQAERACREVRQEHADHEERQFGWRHARAYHAIAQDLLKQSKVKEQACLVPTAVPVATAPAFKPEVMVIQAPPAAPIVITKFILLTDALFPFDKFEEKDLSTVGRQRLNQLIEKLPKLGSTANKINITGYADKLGTKEYNLALSEKRAQTIRTYLMSKGIAAESIKAQAGEWKNHSDSCNSNDKNSQIACLSADRRVEIEVTQ